MAIDSRYIPAFSIEDVLLDKDTGAPLSGGLVYFEQDNQRGVLKPVYQITGTSPNYTYVQLPNPMTLSAIGTFEDALGNPVIPYFFPYDGALNPEYYYVRVTSAGGVEQFTREAVPYIADTGITSVTSLIDNEISNPQFAQVNFNPSSAFTYNFNTVINSTVQIAPDWFLIVSSPGAGSVTLNQLKPVGSTNVVTNPGTILNINSAGLSKLQLVQRFTGSPNLWGNGYLSASFVAKTYSGSGVTLNMAYSQSSGTVIGQTIVSASLPASGTYSSFPGSAYIPISNSSDTNPNGYIDIYFDIPLSTQIDITSVMLAFTGSTPIPNITYNQESNNRQLDHLFHYYDPQLSFKPIPSYLIGWDFPLNPAQLIPYPSTGRSLGPQALGANTSYYAWDQTILFQSVTNSLLVGNNPTFTITANATTQFAVIQYLSSGVMTDLLLQALVDQLSSNLRVSSTVTQKLTISLWWTSNANLPSILANQSLVFSLDANGHPNSVAGGWNEILRINKQQATAMIQPGTVDYGFNGWTDSSAWQTATYFAIVVGSDTVQAGNNIDFKSISLVPGSIPTIPAPQSRSEVLRECQDLFEKSWSPEVPIGTLSVVNSRTFYQFATESNGTANFMYQESFNVPWKQNKRAIPIFTPYSTITLNTPNRVTANYVGYSTLGPTTYGNSGDVNIATFWTQNNIGSQGVNYTPIASALNAACFSISTPNGVTTASAWLSMHYTADARLGVV